MLRMAKKKKTKQCSIINQDEKIQPYTTQSKQCQAFSLVSTSPPSKFQPRAGMWEYLKNLIPAIPKRSLVSWEHRKPLWPEMRVFSSSITPAADAGAAQRVSISWHSLRVHTTISGMLTSHTPSSPPSKGNWRAKRWDFSKRDPKCDNS